MCVPHHCNSSILVFFRLNERGAGHGDATKPRKCDALSVTIQGLIKSGRINK
jgi:hypothetical protein